MIMGMNSSSSGASPNLLTIILDVTTYTWTHRSLARTAQDKALAVQNKSSAGPATLEDVISSILVVCSSFVALNRENALVVLVATEEEVGIVYPRKGGRGGMEDVVVGGGGGVSGGGGGERMDLGLLHDYVRLGVAEMVNRAAERAERKAATINTGPDSAIISATTGTTASSSDASSSINKKIQQQQGSANANIAAALSVALCTINRFLVASGHAGGGVSALANMSSRRQKDDEGILALMAGSDSGGEGGGSSSKTSSSSSTNNNNMLLSPRVLIIQASPDRTADYNALMNCAFAAHKLDIVIDGCFIPGSSGGSSSSTKGGGSNNASNNNEATSSPYLQQLVDRTGGIYLSVPSGAAQVGGALSEVLISVFLPPPSVRQGMNLPKLHDVDFRARCFETGESVDVAQVCNQCLSIFKERPRESCLTCGALVRKKALSSSSGIKRMKLN
jgi:transcription initiation factor TFIIH subunit 3